MRYFAHFLCVIPHIWHTSIKKTHHPARQPTTHAPAQRTHTGQDRQARWKGKGIGRTGVSRLWYVRNVSEEYPLHAQRTKPQKQKEYFTFPNNTIHNRRRNIMT